MAVVIPQVITEDRAATASHVTGSFQFPDRNGQHKLTRNQQNGNQGTYTVSMWIKNSMPDAIGQNPLWSASPSTDNNSYYGLYLGGDQLRVHDGNPSNTSLGSQKLRDPNSWYHIHSKMDSNRLDVYVNGEQYGSYTMLNANWWNNSSYRMSIGSQAINGGVTGSVYAGYQFAQVYHLDGQAFGPEKFGFTDPLTGVWTPKKFTSVNDGTTWSSYTTGSHAFDSGRSPSDGMFKAPVGQYVSALISSAGSTITFAPPSSIKYLDDVQVYVWSETNVSINGGPTQTVPSTTLTTLTDSVGGGEINTITFSGTGNNTNVHYILVDGEGLFDNTSGTYSTWGVNGFYLPMDGKTPINEDQSSNGLTFWTNYFNTSAASALGSLSNHTTLDKATGAIPIMKTDPSGQVIIGGPRTHKITYNVTVQSDGGNKYFLNGTRYSPGTLPMYRGGIYKFDQSDASNATHPLRFATAADAAGSTEYTDGVTQTGTPGQAGAYTLIVVPHNAPDTLYYYCTNHGGMGGPTANTTDIHVADPYAWKCVLAAPFACGLTGSPGDQNYAQSSKEDTINPLGSDLYLTPNNTRNTGFEFAYYGGSRNFNKSETDFITINGTGNGAAFAFGTGDFTLECWAKFNSLGEDESSAILTTASSSQEVGSWIWGFTGANAPTNCYGFCHNVNSSFTWEAGKIDGYFHTWHHYAVCRKDGVIKMFIDGVLWRSFSNTYNFSHQGNPQIGQRWSNTNDYSLDGELQDLRVYKGVAKYFDNTGLATGGIEFQCGTTKPFFLPEVPKGTPYPGILKKIQGGSVHFPATDNYSMNQRLEIPYSTDFDFGSGDFTMECYLYFNSENFNYTPIISHNGPLFGSDTAFYFRAGANRKIQFGFLDTTDTWQGSVETDTNRTNGREWMHVAVTREGTNLNIFLDGRLEGTTSVGSVSMKSQPNETITIGSMYPLNSGSAYQEHYISNLRVVKGTAVYTTNFVPTFEPLEVINNTVLLCCQSSTSASEAAVTPAPISVYKAPEGYDYWTAGYDAGWSVNGTKTSHTGTSSGDYIPSVLPSSGKHYWETVVRNIGTYRVIGVTDDGGNAVGNTAYQDNMSGFYYNGNPPLFLTKKASGTSTAGSVTHGSSTGFNWVNGDTLMWAYDGDNGKMWVGINGFWYASGNPNTDTNPTYINLNTSGSYFKTAYYNAATSSLTVEILSSDVRKPGATNFSPFINKLSQMQGPENNYAVLESSKIKTNTGQINDGGLSFHGSTSAAWNTFPGTMGASSGKWYWEVYARQTSVIHTIGAGQDGSFHMWDTDVYPGQNTYGNAFGLRENGTLYVNGTETTNYVAVWGADDVSGFRNTIGIALDMDEGKAYISINGTWGSRNFTATSEQVSNGTAIPAATGLTGIYRPLVAVKGGTYNWDTLDVNFGQRPFRYAPPEGYKCWNRTNMPSPNRAGFNASKYFKSMVWAGTGVNNTPIDIGFQPDFIWIKCRQPDALSSLVVDSVRGNDSLLSTDDASDNGNSSNFIRSFETYGFKLGTNARVNASSSSRTYAAWCLKAGGNSNTYNVDGVGYSTASAAGLDGGTHTGMTGASVGTKQGFSIIKYDGTSTNSTLAHGLSQTPELMMIKNYDDIQSWVVYNKDLDNPGLKVLNLGQQGSGSNYAAIFNSTMPTSSVLTLGTDAYSNSSSFKYIAYIFHSVDGFSKIGNYIGNGNAAGPVIYTEFKPAFVMIKRIEAGTSGDWFIHDSARYPTNPSEKILRANTNAVESGTGNDIDLLSNGFKIRNSIADVNTGGNEYIYMAFAEAPTNAGFGAVTNAR